MLQHSLFPQSKLHKRTFSGMSGNFADDESNLERVGKGRKSPKQVSNTSNSINNNDSKNPILSGAVPNFNWQRLSAMPPCDFLTTLLKSRGYSAEMITSASVMSKRPALSSNQLQDYDVKLINAVRKSDLETIRVLESEGRTMLACNQFGESVLHIACRSGTPEMVSFMVERCSDMYHVDDYCRSILHDACWRSEPSFEIISCILDRCVDLLISQDIRGHTPLDYVPKDQWAVWCAFLYVQKEKFWPRQPSQTGPANREPLL